MTAVLKELGPIENAPAAGLKGLAAVLNVPGTIEIDLTAVLMGLAAVLEGPGAIGPNRFPRSSETLPNRQDLRTSCEFVMIRYKLAAILYWLC